MRLYHRCHVRPIDIKSIRCFLENVGYLFIIYRANIIALCGFDPTIYPIQWQHRPSIIRSENIFFLHLSHFVRDAILQESFVYTRYYIFVFFLHALYMCVYRTIEWHRIGMKRKKK